MHRNAFFRAPILGRAELSTTPKHCFSPYSDYTALVLFLLLPLEAAFGAVPPAASKASHAVRLKNSLSCPNTSCLFSC